MFPSINAVNPVKRRSLLRPLIVLAALGALFLGAFLHRLLSTPAGRTSPPLARGAASFDLEKRAGGRFCSNPERLPRAEVLHVIDGDTLVVRYGGRKMKLRYYGVDTAEQGQACFDDATARNRALAGSAVRLAFDERPRDSYGRRLAYVFTEDGRSVDAQLVMEGLARAWRRDGRFARELAALENEARALQRGCLWKGPRP